jgi:DNA-binding transcriptional LysR family regulator
MAVSSAARAARTARSVAEFEAGELEILAIMSVAVGMLPESMRQWHRRHPAVPIRLHKYIHVDVLEEELRNGRCDLGIGPRMLGWSGPIVPLGWEEFHVVLPIDDDLRAGASIPIARLADGEWVLFDEDNSLSDVIALVCRRAGGFTPRGVVRTSQVTAAANLAAAGLGATLVPSTIIPPELRATVRPLDPPVARHGVPEVDRTSLGVGEAPVVQDLEERVEDVRVRLLDLVEEDDRVGLPPHGLGELAALLIADVARRCAHEPAPCPR